MGKQELPAGTGVWIKQFVDDGRLRREGLWEPQEMGTGYRGGCPSIQLQSRGEIGSGGTEGEKICRQRTWFSGHCVMKTIFNEVFIGYEMITET